MSAQTNRVGFLTRFARDRRGVSAIEFALIAPVMILFYFGLAELCQGFMAQKRMGRTAATVADLVTQSEVVTRGDVADIFTVGDLMMRPFPAASLEQRVSSVTRQANGRVRVDWSRGSNMDPLAVGAEVQIPAGLIAAGESLVLTEIRYDYGSPVDYIMPALTRFSHAYYLRPRKVERVTCTNC